MGRDLAALLQSVSVFRGESRLSAAGIVLLDEFARCSAQGRPARRHEQSIGFQLLALNGQGFLNTGLQH
jgi:hypothetical protein